jgi:hypothetical protein
MRLFDLGVLIAPAHQHIHGVYLLRCEQLLVHRHFAALGELPEVEHAFVSSCD